MSTWISVDERLPEYDPNGMSVAVLGYDPVCGVRQVSFGKRGDGNGHYFSDRNLGWEGEWVQDVLTHWMPLPDPPEDKP